MASDPVSYRGIILSASPYKEKDSMLSVLTRDSGIVKICAKGTQKPGARNSAASIPFAVVDLECSFSHGFCFLKEVSIVESNSGIMSSLDNMAVAGHISRVLNYSVFQSDMSSEAYQLTAYALYALSTGKASAVSVFCAFNWRYLGIAGFTAPDDPSVKATSEERAVLNMYLECDINKLFVLGVSPVMASELYPLTLVELNRRFESEFADPFKFGL